MTAVQQPASHARSASGEARSGSGGRASRSSSRRPGAPRSGRLVRARPGRHLGPVPLGPLIAWQLVVLVALLAASQGGVGLAVGLFLVAVLAVFTLIPRRGRSLWAWTRVWFSFRRRRAAAAAVPHEPVLGPLREWLPEVELSAIDGRRGTSIGVIFDGQAYVLVLGPDSEELISSANPDTIPLRALSEVGQVEGIRLTSAQLLVRTVAAPAPILGNYAPQVGASYSEINPTYAPALASWWIALRLEPARSAEGLDPETDGPEAIPRALRKVLGWSTKVLASSGLPCRALDQGEIREVLALTAGADPSVAPPGRTGRRSAETWTGWSADGSAHATGWISRFPNRGLRAMSAVWSAMAALPVYASTASLVLTWTPAGELQWSGYVRLSTGDKKSTQRALTQLGRNLRRSRVGFTRLDGEQFLGVVATVPLGGGA